MWWQTPMPFSVVGTRRIYVTYKLIGNVTSCRSVQWASNIYVSVVFGWVGGVLNVLVLFHNLLWEAKLDWEWFERECRSSHYLKFH